MGDLLINSLKHVRNAINRIQNQGSQLQQEHLQSTQILVSMNPSNLSTVRSMEVSQRKNTQAEHVVHHILTEAVWISIHAFGGVDESSSVVEVRTMEGVGARWSGFWIVVDQVEDVVFRGFLEPQMENGHEQRWRH